MVVRTATTTGTKQIIVTPAVQKKRVDIEATVSTDDTIPIANLAAILGAALLKKADGGAVTCTFATNIITVTGAGLTDVPVLGVAYGT